VKRLLALGGRDPYALQLMYFLGYDGGGTGRGGEGNHAAEGASPPGCKSVSCRLAALSLILAHEGEHAGYVALRCALRRNAAVPIDYRGAGIVGCNGPAEAVLVFAVALDEHPQVLGSRIHVLLGNGRIRTVFLSSRRHELHQTDGAFG